MPQKGVPVKGLTGPPKGITTTRPHITQGGVAFFMSEDPATDLRVETSGARCEPPKPKILTTEMMDGISLTQWVGQDPYTMTVDVMIDGYPNRNVETEIRALEALGEVQPGRREPPIVTIDGAVPKPHPNLEWRIVDFGAPTELCLPSGDRCRYFTTVSLVQRVTDRVLVQQLKATSKSKGVKVRTIEVRAGEDYLYEVARRAYKDPSRAADIATANNMHLGKKLSAGQVLRLP